ncbi:PTS system IIA component (Glc family) [Hydrogenoanaerobacterium saccharovorans]|uniref:PTS system IIA component, Glc family n=1 Tax=Hydrogenoanaerobacterium saccharovorans TaxID=474960 RepID=A0A1H8AFZ5_9FIRM|nr:PTS glucose transporter subunit IIA [Hydrogenoanaerobacterium saccharovorans]RPF47965.1 PTS system IIA component (Glc family) [Hydrogenoanaerobacterium saccharovorans]SEM69685.1 PTS system IIA component, Glc family [Hydrogenoanaerobacterium saccharovorans]
MGLLNKIFGGNKEKNNVILSPVEGEAVPISEVSDPTFGEEILGKGIAVKPNKGRVVSPVTGTIDMMFDTGHAVSILSNIGTEILIHVGLDTVKLKGKHYKTYVKNGDKVKIGDLLIEFDIDAILSEGYDVITPIVICNTPDYAQVEPLSGKAVHELDELIILKK